MKKRILATVVALITATVFFNSCDILSGGPALNQEGAGQKVKERIEKNLDPESIVYNVTLYTEDEFSYKLRMITVYYSEPGSTDVVSKIIHISPASVKDSGPDTYKNRKPESGVALKDIDLSSIPGNISKASSFLAENEVKSSGMGLYRFTVNSAEPGDVGHKFTLHEKGKTTTVGNRQQIEYFKYDFVADNEGNVEYVE